jgi:hypothetical protein
MFLAKACKEMMQTQTYLTTEASNLHSTWDACRLSQIAIRSTQKINAVVPPISHIVRIRHIYSIGIYFTIVEVCKRPVLLIPFITLNTKKETL